MLAFERLRYKYLEHTLDFCSQKAFRNIEIFCMKYSQRKQSICVLFSLSSWAPNGKGKVCPQTGEIVVENCLIF